MNLQRYRKRKVSSVETEKGNNINKRLTRRKKIVFSILAPILFILICEIFSFSVLCIYFTIDRPELGFIKNGWKKSLIGRLFQKPSVSPSVFDSTLTHSLTPNLQEDGRLHTDKHGFVLNDTKSNRDLAFKSPSMIRIFILGGSTVMGSGPQGNENTITAQLEKILNQQYSNNDQKKYQVVNGGVGGYISADVLRILTFKVIHFLPDIVITFDGFSDFVNSCTNYDGRSKVRSNKKVKFGSWSLNKAYYDDKMEYAFRNLLNLKGLVVMATRKFCENFFNSVMPYTKRLIEGVNNELRGLFRGHPGYKWEARFRQEGVDNYLTNLKSIRGICAAHNIRGFNVLQPNLALFKPLTDSERDALNIETALYKNYKNAVEAYYRAVRKHFKEEIIASQDQDTVIDMVQLFENTRETIYTDGCHYNSKGNKIIAEALAKLLTND